MANSTSPVPQVVEGAGAVRKVNDLFDAGSGALIGGRDAATSALLVFGIIGGRVNGVDKANTTVTLTASTTNYIVMAKSGLAVSAATTTTNWNDSANYWRLYSVVTNTTTFTSYTDERFSAQGIQAPGVPWTGGTLASPINEATPVTIASAATVNIGAAAANSITVSGTTTITAFDTIAAGAKRQLVFSGALLLTHNGTSLILPTGVSITTAAGDVADFVSLGSGNWRCVNYSRASGNALLGSPFTGGTLTSSLNEAPTVTIASSATPAIGAAAGNSISLTGTTTVTGFDTIAAGAKRLVIFAGALTLTYNATSLILPTAANITTAAGDVAEFVSLGSGNWRCTNYLRANGNAIIGSLLTTVNAYAKNQSVTPVTNASVTGTYTPDASASNNFNLTLTGNTTIANPTNLTAGMVLNFCLDEDATGGRTIAFGTMFKWPGATVPTWVTTASAKNFFSAYYDGTILRCGGGGGYA